jgi:hypothetical protein
VSVRANKERDELKTRRTRKAPWGNDTDRGLELAVKQVWELLEGLDLSALKEQLGTEVREYARLVALLTQLNDARLKHDKHRAEEAAERAEARKEKAAKSQGEQAGVRPQTIDRIENALTLF